MKRSSTRRGRPQSTKTARGRELQKSVTNHYEKRAQGKDETVSEKNVSSPDTSPQPQEHEAAERRFWEQQLRVSSRQATAAIVLNFLTGGAAIVGLLGLIFVYMGISATNESTFEANRAWLSPENFEFSMIDNRNIKQVIVKGDTQNLGHTPATDVFFSPDFDSGILTVAPDADPRSFKIPEKDLCANTVKGIQNTKILKFKGIIFPSEKLDYERLVKFPQIDVISDTPNDSSFLSTSFSEIIASKVMDGSMIVYFQDCVVYKTFDVIRSTPFCRYWRKTFIDSTMKTFKCASGNDAD